VPGPTDAAAAAFDKAAQSAQDAADSADALRQQWDLLTGASSGVQETALAQAQAFSALKERIDGAAAGTEDFGNTMDLSTKAGQDNAAAIIATSDAIKSATIAMIQQKGPTEDTIQGYRDQRKALIDQIEPFFKNREAAARYVTQLGLVPPSKVTQMALVGADTAEGAIKKLRDQIDTIQDKRAEIIEEGADPSSQRVRNLNDRIIELQGKIVQINEDGADPAAQRVRTLKERIDFLKGKRVEVIEDGASPSSARVQDLDDRIAGLQAKTINVAANVSGTDSVNNLATAVNNLHDKQITVTTNIVGGAPIGAGLNPNPGQHGGQAQYGGMLIGEAGPEFYRYGATRGLVTSPTVVPSGTMVTSAALTAALLRSQTGSTATGQTIGRQLNLVQNIQTVSEDPVAVATQVMNRAAAMAGV